jgi:hypothetical protein
MRTRYALAAVLAALAMPGRAVACAVCLGNAFGDRSYTWPYLGLILMPFIVAGGIVGAVAWQLGWRPRTLVARLSAAVLRAATLFRPARPAAAGHPSPPTHTETT